MTQEELISTTSFITNDAVPKRIQVYVTTESTSIQLFNLRAQDHPGFLNIVTEWFSTLRISDGEVTLEEYSTSCNADEFTLYEYDLPLEDAPEPIRNLSMVNGMVSPNMYDTNVTPLSTINGLYVKVQAEGQTDIVLYKAISQLDKLYVNNMFFLVVLP